MRRRLPRRWYLPAAAAVLITGLLPGAASTAALSGLPRPSLKQQSAVHPTYSVIEPLGLGAPVPPMGGTLGLQYGGMYVDVVPLTGSGATALEARDVRIRVTTSGTTTGYYTCATTATSRRFLCSYGGWLGGTANRPGLATVAPNAPAAAP